MGRHSCPGGVVDDDHLRRQGLGSLTDTCRPVQPPLGVSQSGLNALELTARQQRPGKVHAEHGPAADHLVGDHLKPALHRGFLPGPAHGRDRQLNQVRRAPEIPGGQRVPDGLGRLAAALVPRARPPVQVRHLAGLLVEQPRIQHVGEELVVAIPPAAVIERDQDKFPRSSAASMALPSPCPVTASHSGPLSRPKIEVCSKKAWTRSG